MWNFAFKIIRSKALSVCTFWSKPNRNKGIFSSTCMSLYRLVHWHQTRKLDTSKISEAMFLLHRCKNHTLEFLLSVSSTNNCLLVKVCKILKWNLLSCVSFVVRIVLENISPPFNSEKADSICTHFILISQICTVVTVPIAINRKMYPRQNIT